MDATTDLGEVEHWSDEYESALRRNDVDVMLSMFWDDPAVLRFGIADEQHGTAELRAWRAAAPPINPDRITHARHVVALAPGVVAVDITFADDDDSIGRQSQTWVRRPEGWRIVRAHVSVIPRPVA